MSQLMERVGEPRARTRVCTPRAGRNDLLDQQSFRQLGDRAPGHVQLASASKTRAVWPAKPPRRPSTIGTRAPSTSSAAVAPARGVFQILILGQLRSRKAMRYGVSDTRTLIAGGDHAKVLVGIIVRERPDAIVVGQRSLKACCSAACPRSCNVSAPNVVMAQRERGIVHVNDTPPGSRPI